MTDEEFVNTVVGMVDPSRDVEIRMSPRDYARFIAYGRGRYEPEVDVERLRRGEVGQLFVDGEHSVAVKVVKDMVPGAVSFAPLGGFGARGFILYPAEPESVEYASRFEREIDL